MKIIKIGVAVITLVWTTNALSFDTTTKAKVTYIDEWDTGYTKVTINKNTSCGNSYFWMLRTMKDYDLYMARVLAALVSGRQIRITERAPAFCQGVHLYNPRIGVM